MCECMSVEALYLNIWQRCVFRVLGISVCVRVSVYMSVHVHV